VGFQAFRQRTRAEGAEDRAGRNLKAGPEGLAGIGRGARKGGVQQPLGEGGAIQGGRTLVQILPEPSAILCGLTEQGVHQSPVGREAQFGIRCQGDAFMHGCVIAHALHPGQLGQAQGQGRLAAQGHAAIGILEARTDP